MENQEYAGFWIRFGALLIDVVIMIIFLFIPTYLIYGDDYLYGTEFILGFWDVLLNYIVPLVATIWFWLRYLGTPGKMLLKLRVVDAETGNTLSLGQAVGRYFAYIPAMLALGVGIIWVAFDKKKQGWHDKLAGSVVVRG